MKVSKVLEWWMGAGEPVLPPVNTSSPLITGTRGNGNLLTVSTGSWDNVPTGYIYQWKRDGVNIAGATNNTYNQTPSDDLTTLTVVVTASNSAGSASATSKNFDIGFAEVFGIILNDSFNRGAIGASYTVTSTTQTVSLDGANMNLSGGNGTFANTIEWLYGNSFEDVELECRHQLNSVPGASTFGIGIGFKDFSSPDGRRDVIGQLYLTTSGTIGGEALIQLWDGTTNTLEAQSAGNLVRNSGEWYILKTRRHIVAGKNRYTVTAIRELDSSEVSTFWEEPLSYPQTKFGNSTGNFCIYNIGASIKVDYLKITVSDLKKVAAVPVGDSKTHGAYATDQTQRWAANVYPSGAYSISAGSGDVTQRVLDKIQNLIDYNPRRYLIMIGGNDIRSGVSSATWQANLNSIRSQLKTAHPNCIITWCGYPQETSIDVTPINTYILAKIADLTYSGDTYINTYPLNTGTDLTADGVHPDPSGHTTIAANAVAGLNI